jgi:hypothetical protein
MKIEAGMKCKQTKALGSFNYVGEKFEVTQIAGNNVIIIQCWNKGIGFGVEPEEFEEYFELVDNVEKVDNEIKVNNKKEEKSLKLENIKIGEKYRVIKNRDTCFGCCYDLIDIEGQEVEVYDIQEESLYIKSKNRNHVCRVENLEAIEKIDEKSTNTEKINKVYTYTAPPFKVNWEIIHNGEVTHETVDSEEFSYKVIANGNTTIVILNDDSKGIAKCLQNDIYDINKGVNIAFTKALIKSYTKKLKKLVK